MQGCSAALGSADIYLLPATIKKKADKVYAEILDIHQRAQEKLGQDDPEPWGETWVSEWPAKIGGWKALRELLASQIKAARDHA